MTLPNKGTGKDKITLYIPPDKKQLLIPKAKKILEREGSSISEFFVKRLESYVNLHDEGNPQQTLTRTLKDEPVYVAPKCFVCGAEAVGFVENLKLHRNYPACEKHVKACLESGKWKEANV